MGRRRSRKLIIIRGLPGSGKTRKAKQLLNEYGGGIIVSADDYFRNGPDGEMVDFHPSKLRVAHERAMEKASDAMSRKENPVIIDNINMEFQYMYPYVFMGFRRGYWIEFVDLVDEEASPDEYYRRCQERIPLEKFEKWLDAYRRVRHIYQILYDPVSRRRWKNYRW
ncbi:NEDD4-binding protein 2-like 1 [Sardina pilchardus]|uniref:NEDD4-binding protein 2-like 1 n=1 Tax=Sardina pilchardus TaxID=27697 RepID=UPI002E15480B